MMLTVAAILRVLAQHQSDGKCRCNAICAYCFGIHSMPLVNVPSHVDDRCQRCTFFYNTLLVFNLNCRKYQIDQNLFARFEPNRNRHLCPSESTFRQTLIAGVHLQNNNNKYGQGTNHLAVVLTFLNFFFLAARKLHGQCFVSFCILCMHYLFFVALAHSNCSHLAYSVTIFYLLFCFVFIYTININNMKMKKNMELFAMRKPKERQNIT